MTDSPVISIVIAVYNGANTLQRCLHSVITQTYDNIELIIIDAASTDDTVAIIKENESRVAYWETKEDRGIYHAWNKALKHVNGEWVYFLGADDYLWNDRVLEEMLEELWNAYPDYRVVYGQVALVNHDNEVLYYEGEPWEKVKHRFKHFMSLPHQGIMHHRSLFKEHGEFDESFKIVGDYDFLLRELREKDALFMPDMIVAGMEVGGISSDPSQGIILLKEIQRSHQKFGYTGESFDWWLAYIKVRSRMLVWQVLGESIARFMLDIGRILMGKPRHWTRTKQ